MCRAMKSNGRALSCLTSLPIRADDGVHRRQVRLRVHCCTMTLWRCNIVTKSRVAMNADVAKTDESRGRGSSRLPLPLLSGAWAFLGLAFVWLVWNTYNAYHVDNLIHARQIRTEALRGVIVHLDDASMMAARMVTVTGEQRWEERYQQLASAWGDALHEAQGLR